MTKPHSIETNVSVTVVLLVTAGLLILQGEAASIIQPLGVLSGWLVSEIISHYRSK